MKKSAKNIDKKLEKNTVSSSSEQKSRFERLTRLIETELSKQQLERFYTAYGRLFATHHAHILDEFSLGNLPAKPFKEQLAKFIAAFFASKSSAAALLLSLPEHAKEFLELLVWSKGSFTADDIKERLGFAITSEIRAVPRRFENSSPDASLGIKPEFLLVPFTSEEISEETGRFTLRTVKFTYTFFLPDKLRDILQEVIEEPAFAQLEVLQEAPNTEFRYRADERAVIDLPVLAELFRAGTLRLSKSGTVLKSSLEYIRVHLPINDFFEGKNPDLPDTAATIAIEALSEIIPQEFLATGMEVARSVVHNIHDGKFSALKVLGKHLQGYGAKAREQHPERNTGNLFLEELKRCQPSVWYSSDTFIQSLTLHSGGLRPVPDDVPGLLVFYRDVPKSQRSWRDFDAIGVSVANYNTLVSEPLTRGYLFLFAVLGFVEIAFDQPKNSTFPQRGMDFMTPFDGLRAFCITPFGAYALGLTDDISQIQTDFADGETYELDAERLIIRVHGSMRMVRVFLERIGDRLSDSLYRITSRSFFRTCSDITQVSELKKLFFEYFGTDIPPIWKEFIDELDQNVHPLTEEYGLAIFTVKNSPEIQHLFVSDPILKKLVRRAEGSTILTEREHVPKLKERLREFGYFL